MMKWSKQISLGFSSYSKAFRLIFSTKLWLYFFWPLLINIALFLGGFWALDKFSGWLKSLLFSTLGLTAADGFFSGILSFFLKIVVDIVYFAFFVFLGGYIVLILLSPVMAYVSEKTEELLCKATYPFNFNQFIKDVFRGITLSLRNALIQILFTIIALLIGFIPVIGLASPIFIFGVGSYFYGFSFMDYTNERKKLKVKQSVNFVRQYKMLAITNGSIFAILLFIPFCGVSFAGFMALWSVVAATVALIEIEEKNKLTDGEKS